MGLIRFFRGWTRVKITGAGVEYYLNQLAFGKISFWNIVRQDELHYYISVYRKDIKNAERLALRCFCNFEPIKHNGAPKALRHLRKRPVLLFGLLVAVTMSFCMQSFVLAIDVHGNETLHEEQILRALQELQIDIGSRSDTVDQQLTKHRMLNLLPELSWIGVNRNGFKLDVLVTERHFAQTNRPKYKAGNIVASRDSVISELNVSEGMRLCKVGDVVKKGQILVSGFEDYGLILKGVCAEAEIYGQTWYSGMLVMPSKAYQKQYTGRQWTKYSLIFGRKRINLSGSSGILGMTCDKIIDVKKLAVPNYEFPVYLECVTYREYEPIATAVDANTAQARLEKAWRELLLSQMIAGEIITTEASFFCSDELHVMQFESTCNEMIARLVPMAPVYEGDTNE